MTNSTNFVSGTKITKEWLNDVNSHVFSDAVSVDQFPGADATGATSSAAAVQAATNTGKAVLFPDGIWDVSGVTYSGKVIWYSNGGAKIISDGDVLTVTNGDGSIIDNLELTNKTAPWIITRNPANWSATMTPVQSNSDGYQPTVNDSDIWGSLTGSQQSQNIGPTLNLTGSEVAVSRIRGRFVRVNMVDCQRSSVSKCNIRGGKGTYGAIMFYNIGTRGVGNKALDNHVRYASFNGIVFIANDRFTATGNTDEYCGESGIKTYQNTISSTDARCYFGLIKHNRSNFNYYDGIDAASDYPYSTVNSTFHDIQQNYSIGNRNVGVVTDGTDNTVSGNYLINNGLDGILAVTIDSTISVNHLHNNNTQNIATGHHEINLGVYSGNHLVGNFITRSSVYNGNAIYAVGTNYISGTKAKNCYNFTGNANAVTAIELGTEDSVVSPQGVFTPTLFVGATSQTLATAIGAYTRVGKRVFFDITVTMGAAVSGTGVLTVPLPWTPVNRASYIAIESVLANKLTFTGQLSALVSSNTGSVSFWQMTSGAVATQLQGTALASDTTLYISGSFEMNK